MLGDHFILLSYVSSVCCLSVFDFEENSELCNFQWPDASSFDLSKTRYKHGKKSLEWKWAASGILSLDLSSKNNLGDAVENGGVRLWVYNVEEMSVKCLTITVETKLKKAKSRLRNNTPLKNCLMSSRRSRSHSSSFYISLDFTGWRAVWVAFKEFKDCPTTATSTGKCYQRQVTKIKITAPDTVAANPVHIDLLRWTDKISKQSRDQVVPPIKGGSNCYRCESLHTDKASHEQAALNMHDRSVFWQQTYRWSLHDAPTENPLTDQVLAAKLSDLELIEKRLLNWYADEKKSFTKLANLSQDMYPAGVVTSNFYLRERWEGSDGLMENINRAYKVFRKLQIRRAGTVITGSPLFCKVSRYNLYGTTNFVSIMIGVSVVFINT